MIWDFQDALTRRLLLWSTLSGAAGVVLLLGGDPFFRGFGLQALAWGLIDAAIAALGRRSARKRRVLHAPKRADAGAGALQALEKEARNLRRLLWVNTGLDVLYVAGGLVLVYSIGVQSRFAAGNGWGVVLQGGFLFVFDLVHALAVPRSEPALPALTAFDGPEHAAFRLAAADRIGENDAAPAALLVHGFGGTPAEMRGLAEALHREGWTTDALLLPGFGPDLSTLTQRQHTEWLAAVESAARGLADAGHRPLLLVGYSMGATLCLVAAKAVQPDGLVVLAPFWWEEKWWTRPLEFFVRPFLPIGFRPLRKADFADPRLRQGIGKFMPGIDLDDAAAQQAMRDFRMPLGLIDQIRALSRRALAAAGTVGVPVLVVQGIHDSVVRASQTRGLIRRFPTPPRYLEVDNDHDLTLPESAAWPLVRGAIVAFSQHVGTNARTGASAGDQARHS